MKTVVADWRYRVLCLRIVPKSGPVIRLTHHPRDLVMSNGQTYKAHAGNDFTGYSADVSMSPGLVDLEGVAGLSGVTKDAVMSGVYDGARCYLFATTWRTPVEDEEPITASLLGKTTLIDDRYRIEEMGLIDALNQSVGSVCSPMCDHTFGDAWCSVDLAPITVTGSITHVTDGSVFRDAARTEAADWFAMGVLRWTSGQNVGLPALDIKRYEADGTIESYSAAYYGVTVGDTYEMEPGCRKRLEDCRDKWGNVLQFWGKSFVPTQSTYGQIGAK